MTDEVFIKTILQKGGEAKDKARFEFLTISSAQLNWRASPESWSIGQCLHHLIVSNGKYIPIFNSIASGKHTMTFWEKYNPLSSYTGQKMIKTLGDFGLFGGGKAKKAKKFEKMIKGMEKHFDANGGMPDMQGMQGMGGMPNIQFPPGGGLPDLSKIPKTSFLGQKMSNFNPFGKK